MNQTVRARYEYDPWGRITKVQGDKDSPRGYAGYFWHAQSGLNLTLYRAYDPNLGRWISRDPIEEAGGIDLYVYVLNSPINDIDPLGLSGPGFWTKLWRHYFPPKPDPTPVPPNPPKDNPSAPYPDKHPGQKYDNCIEACKKKLLFSGSALPACFACCASQEEGIIPPDKDCTTYFCKVKMPK